MSERKNTDKTLKKRNVWCAVAIMTVLAVVGFVFAALCATRFNIGFFERHRVLFTVLLLAVVLLVSVFTIVFYFIGKETAYKLTISVFVLLDFTLIVFFCLLATGFLTVVNSVESFKAYLESAGVWMDVLFIVLQYLQVIILPIPSFVTLTAGTMLFGATRCFLYSFFAIVFGSLTAFFIGRFLGYRAVSWIVGKDTLDTWLKKVKGKDNLILTAMFILPLFPDDVLCFIAGLSTMTNRYFVCMIIIARAISVSTTCFSVGFIPFNTWWGILCWALIAIFVIALFIVFYKNQDRIQKWINKRKKKKQSVKK